MKLNKLHLLKELYGEIIIPFAVYLEIEAGKDKAFYKDLSTYDWIKINRIEDSSTTEYLFDLDDGEAEVLILAREIEADLVLLDETLGRRYAKQLNLRLTGTMGVLLKAKSMGLIPSLKTLLTELTEKGTWLNSKLISKVLELAGE